MGDYLQEGLAGGGILFTGSSPLLVNIYPKGRLAFLVCTSKSRSGQLIISYLFATHTSATIEKFWVGGKRGGMCLWVT